MADWSRLAPGCRLYLLGQHTTRMAGTLLPPSRRRHLPREPQGVHEVVRFYVETEASKPFQLRPPPAPTATRGVKKLSTAWAIP